MELVGKVQCGGGDSVTVSIDASELRTLATDLQRIPDKVQRGVRPVVSKGALNVKNQLQSEMGGSTHFGQIKSAISYDIKVKGDGVEAEIGPRKGSPGSLANIAYFGGARGGGTVPDPSGAMNSEADRFASALSKLLDGVL